jgi:hypothetical protein
MPDNVPSATALTFEEWFAAYSAEEFGADQRGAHFVESVAEEAWNARVPEIDAMRDRERRLLEYARKASDHYERSACSTCIEIRDGLAELLAAEGARE